jgi:RHS repeat-associated protein
MYQGSHAMPSTAHRLALLFVILLCSARSGLAQVATGTPPFGSFGGGPDVINLANLNAHLNIPILNKPGRGLPFNFYLTYDSSVWFPVTSGSTKSWQPAPSYGWGGSELNIGTINKSGTVQMTVCTQTGKPSESIKTTIFWSYTDGFGTVHPFPGSTITITGTCEEDETTSLNATASDGSGYTLSATGATFNSLYTADGSLINPTALTVTDRNGNQISESSGVFTDTLGTTALTMANATPSAATPTTYTYTAPAGATKYTVNYTNYTVATNFGISGISDTKISTAVPLPTSIVLPDGSQYTFTYEPTPTTPASGACTPLSGTTSCVTARLASVTFPTGGTIKYAYSGGNNGILPDGSAATLTRTTPDGTWTYAQVKGIAPASITTVTDPLGNVAVINFQYIYETQRQAYQGATSGTLLVTTNTCYNGTASPVSAAACTSTAITPPITQRAVTTILPGTNNLTAQHIDDFNAAGAPTESDDYDYGSGAVGAVLRKVATTYASLGNIAGFRQTVTVTNAAGTIVSQTTYNYDETAVVASSNTPQHTSITTSRGNLTSIDYPVGKATANGKDIASSTYFDTGTLQTSTDVNGSVTTYTYSNAAATCGNAFPTGSSTPAGNSSPVTLTTSSTWNCSGGVLTSTTDANGKVTMTTYANNKNYWLPDSTTDPTSATVNFTYNGQTSAEAALSVNSGNSTSDTLVTVDASGRPHIQQTRQAPGGTNFDSVETDYDAVGRPSRITLPYTATAGTLASSSAPGVTTLYDALSRPTMVMDAGGGFTSSSYPQNDVLVTVGPATSGENAKRRQLEYDALGRLTSVCEITAGTTAAPAAACAQNSSQTGYLTKYTYDALGNLLTVTQNAQATAASQQTRTYTFDAIGRVLSETNPETSTISYTYDADPNSICGQYEGALVKRVDNAGNTTCYTYDNLHRLTSQTYTGSGANVASTPNKYFVYDAATVNGVAMTNAKGRMVEAYTTAPGTASTAAKVTDIGFSYSVRGELTDVYEATPNSGGYNHSAALFWENGAPKQLTGPGLPTFTIGLDGEGRAATIAASAGQNPVSATAYNPASLPTTVTLGSGDSDAFTYDANTLRLTQYKVNVASQSVTGNLGWNANGSLGSLNITDPLNSANTQNCSYAADDLSRIASANCGAIWGQSFSYDAFGNVSKQVLSSSAGTSFLPTYQSSPSITNRIASLPGGVTPTYDANGNSLNDSFRQYTWDAENWPLTVVSGSTTVNLTYDALGRMVEQARGASYTQIVYSTLGGKLAKMNGATLQTGYVPLTSGASAVYSSSGLAYYRHPDHLGSSRLATTPTQTLYSDTAYSAFGEPYAQSGTADPSFTGQDQDTVAGMYDFLYRKYDPAQSRWTSPDPSGLAAVNPAFPQSWNRYAYVQNNPLGLVDPLGLNCVNSDGDTIVDADGNEYTTQDACTGGGGIWVPPAPSSSINVNASGPGDAPLVIFQTPNTLVFSNSSGPNKPTPCKNGLGTGGAGVGAGYNVDAGVGAAGASSTGGVGAGAFHNSGSGFSGGLFGSGGATAYAGSHIAGAPTQTSSTFSLGAYVGAGANFFFTNAGGAQQLSGPFTTVSINVGIGVANLGVQLSFGGGIYQLSVTPPLASVGIGAAGSVVTTNTVATHAGCH